MSAEHYLVDSISTATVCLIWQQQQVQALCPTTLCPREKAVYERCMERDYNLPEIQRASHTSGLAE